MLYDGSSADAVTEKLRLAYLVLAILLFNAILQCPGIVCMVRFTNALGDIAHEAETPLSKT